MRLAEKFELVAGRAAEGSKYGTENQVQHQENSTEVGEADAEPLRQTSMLQTAQSLEGLCG